MAASMWKGNISFGLVNIPVKLYTAIDTSKDISFNQLDSKDYKYQGIYR
jgi:DNA end-binding protein Ku